ncbi:hypothetical protein QW180_08670 [Vibrio sinaloensis]|nr:hypothetical protein [Vibrio sinaloensis]
MPAKDELALYNVMREMVVNEELRHNMGLAAYKRSCTDFSQKNEL